MPTLLDPTDRAAMVERLRSLSPSDQAQWGTLDAPRMLCHVSDQLRVALGDIPATFRGTFLSKSVLKWLVIRTPFQAPPGKVQTVPEMLLTKPAAWSDDLQAGVALIDRVGRGDGNAIHPGFGRLSAAEWGALGWKHLDHHLRQFGH